MAKTSRRYHHGDLRAALLARAVAALDAAPDADLTLRGLAKEVGVSPMAPYAHFDDKEALLDAVAADGFEVLSAALDDALAAAPDDPEARLATLADAYISFGLARPGLYRLMFTGRRAPEGSHARVSGRAAISRLERTVAALAPNGDGTRLTTDIAWALVHGLTLLTQGGYLQTGSDLAERIAAASRTVVALARRPETPSGGKEPDG